MDEEEQYADTLGVVAALERTCELESRLRQAIADTHPLTTTLDWDFEAADREREALLAISEQLEYLEDKLREYRFLEANDEEHQAVVLSQLDNVRRELVEVVQQRVRHVQFGKDVVREVMAFACVNDDASAEQREAGEQLGHEGKGDHDHRADPRVLRSSHNTLPPRYPDAGRPAAKEHTPGRSAAHDGSPQVRSPHLGSGGSRQDARRRSPGHGVHWSDAASPGPTSSHERRASASPGTAATVAAPADTDSASSGRGGAGSRRQIEQHPSWRQGAGPQSQTYAALGSGDEGRRQAERDAPWRPGQGELSEGHAGQTMRMADVPATQQGRRHIEPEPRQGYLAGVRASAAENGRAMAGVRAAGAAQGGRILSRMDRKPYTAGPPTSARSLRDEDIFGAVNGAGRPASIYNPSPQKFGGMLRIREMMERAEEDKEATRNVPREPPPHPPHIYGGADDVSEWDGSEGGLRHAASPPRTRSASATTPPRPRRPIIRDDCIDDETLWNGPSRLEQQVASTGGHSSVYGYSTGGVAGGEGHHRRGLLGRLARLALTGAAAAAVAVAAKHAGPVVAEKGQHVVKHVSRQLQDVQQNVATAVAARHAAHKREQERQRKARFALPQSAVKPQPAPKQQLVPQPAPQPQPAPRPQPQPAPQPQQVPKPQEATPKQRAEPVQKQQHQQQQRGGRAPRIADMPPWLESGDGSKQRRDPVQESKLPRGAAAAAAKKSSELQPRVGALPSRPPPDVSMVLG